MSQDFENRTRKLLDESANRLDGHTRSRLTQARHAALSALDRPRHAWWRPVLPVGAGAAAAVLAVVMWTGQPTEFAPPANGAAFEDIDLLADADAPDFITYADDLEFYEWAVGEVDS